MKYFVFGDTGGHFQVLKNSLQNLNVDLTNYIIPPDVTIIHTGDLIHKGPHSSEILHMVDKLIINNPGRWVQVLGNHEYQHLGGPFFWNCDCTVEDTKLLHKWVTHNQATPAYGVNTPLMITPNPTVTGEPTQWLFTHGGVTRQFFEQLGTTDAEATAEAINNLPVKKTTWPGQLLYGKPHYKVGCVWAVGCTEVYSSWVGAQEPVLFNQVYGHTTSFLWKQKKWRNDLPDFENNSIVNPLTRSVSTSLGETGNLMIGIDPGYENYATEKNQSYITLE